MTTFFRIDDSKDKYREFWVPGPRIKKTYLVASEAFCVGFLAKRTPELIVFILVMTEQECVIAFAIYVVVGKAIVNDDVFPFAEPPEVELEDAGIRAGLKGLVGGSDAFKKSRTSGNCCQGGEIPEGWGGHWQMLRNGTYGLNQSKLRYNLTPFEHTRFKGILQLKAS